MLVALVRPALAADDDAAQAAAHARKASAAIDLGNYLEAAKEYEAAYMAKPDPQTLLSVGQAWQLAGERQKALTAFRSCLRLTATAEQHAACQARERELEPAAQPAPTGWAPAPVLPVPNPAPVVAPVPAPSPTAWQPEPAPAIVQCPPPQLKVVEASHYPWSAWTVFGAIVVTGIVLGFVYLNQNTDLAMPNTTFGTKQF